jgi:hypothetical protein
LRLVDLQLFAGVEEMIHRRRNPGPWGRADGRLPGWGSRHAPAVVTGTPDGIAEDCIGLIEAAQARLSVRIARVDIGVVLGRQPMVSPLDVIGTGIPTDPQNPIVIRLTHR